MLSVADLAGMRETVDSALPDTCTVIDDVLTSDGAGGQTVGSTTTATYACRIAPRLATGTGQLKDAEVLGAGRITIQAPWLITMPTGAVVSATSHIADSHGRHFEVFAVLAPRSDELSVMSLARLINEGDG
jgi:hypothetical protein